ncbi:MAG: hypothetical protein ACXVB0_01350 [Mucilaginibacter sp.]
MSKKPNVVYFLGAGCSKNFGYPLTGQIMPEILTDLRNHDLFQLKKSGKTEEERQFETDLLDYIYLLYPGLKNLDPEKDGIPNITEVLSFVDYCCFYNIPPHPDFNSEKLEYFQTLLNRAVGELLLTYDQEEYKPEERKLLDQFIGPIKNEDKNSEVTVITTNYDLIIDYEFVKLSELNRIDYGIPYRNIPDSKIVVQTDNPLFRYYKLHGSLNWLKCDYCGHYYINSHGSILHQMYKPATDDGNTCICSESLRLKSVLVAPSLVRDIRDSNLLQIWKSALEAIRSADRLVFIGYSLPAEDLAIKSIIIRGINARDKKAPLRVDVVQKDGVSKPNFTNLFADNLNYYSDGLGDYLSKTRVIT